MRRPITSASQSWQDLPKFFMPSLLSIREKTCYNNSIETLDEKDGFFHPVKVEDFRQFDAVSKASMEDRAIAP